MRGARLERDQTGIMCSTRTAYRLPLLAQQTCFTPRQRGAVDAGTMRSPRNSLPGRAPCSGLSSLSIHDFKIFEGPAERSLRPPPRSPRLRVNCCCSCEEHVTRRRGGRGELPAAQRSVRRSQKNRLLGLWMERGGAPAESSRPGRQFSASPRLRVKHQRQGLSRRETRSATEPTRSA